MGAFYKISNSDHPTPAKSSNFTTGDQFSNPTSSPTPKFSCGNTIRHGMINKTRRDPWLGCVSPQETAPCAKTLYPSASRRESIHGGQSKTKNQKPEKPAFTLIELMAATTVLSVVLLMMVGMQDQMSKAWSNANRRTDATREARAACRIMARDFSYFLIRGTNISRNMMRASNVATSPVPLYYFSGSGAIPSPSLTMPINTLASCSYIFGVFPKKKSSLNDSDFALAGYYIAQTKTNNINGFNVTNCNLYRYYITSNDAVAALCSWLTNTPNPNNLFPNIATTNIEILARNACNLSIKVYGSTNSGNGLIYSNNYGAITANGLYQGNKIHVELSVYPEEIAQKLPNVAAWTNPANIQRLARTFEFNVDWPESVE